MTRAPAGRLGAFFFDAAAFGLAGVALVLPLYLEPDAALPFEPAKVSFFRVATIVIAVLLGLSRLFGVSLDAAVRASYPLFLGALGVGVTQVLATVQSIDASLSWWGGPDEHGTVTSLILVAFFFLVASMARSREARTRIVDAAIAGSVPVMLYSLLQLLQLDPLAWETDSISPMGSTLGRSNVVGAYLAILAPFTLARALGTHEGRASRGLAALLAAQVTCIFLTQARAAWCAATVGLGILASLYLGKRRHAVRRRFAVSGLIVVVATGVLVFAAMNLLDVASLVGSRDAPTLSETMANRTGTVRSRLAIWSAALRSSRTHPVLGHGPQTFSSVFDSRALDPTGRVVVAHPHNILLDYFFGSGVLGVSAFVFLVIAFYAVMGRRMARETASAERKLSGALIGSVSAFLVQAQFNPEAVVLSVLFWLNLGLGAAGTDA